MVEFVYLASESPRRRELLQQIGVPFLVVGAGIDETALPSEPAATYVTRVAQAKADHGWRATRGAGPEPVLAADTAVVVGRDILGKPADRDDAARMLRALSGRTHVVLTAVSLRSAAGCMSRVSRSEVTFRDISATECAAYWDSGEARGKAGGYAIQGLAAVFVAALSGSHSGVMGLPLFETAELLDAAGVPRWRHA